VFSAFAGAKHETTCCAAATRQGGHLVVGLKASLYLDRGRLARSNAEQGQKPVRILSELGPQGRHTRSGPRDAGAQTRVRSCVLTGSSSQTWNTGRVSALSSVEAVIKLLGHE
jgi:hypothetical protein